MTLPCLRPVAHLMQLWLFWAAPIIGGIIGAVTYRFIRATDE
ncbi:MAG: hypothetical protein R3E95_08740 [Thiolinea sp.]